MALKILAELGLDGRAFESGLRGVEARVKGFAGSVSSRIGALFSVGMMGYGIRRVIEYAGSLSDLAARTGSSVEALQRLGQAARENGADLEDVVKTMEALNVSRERALANAKGPERKAFGVFGISRADLKTLGAEDLLRRIGEKWRSTQNVETLVAPLREIGARGAMKLAAALSAGLDEHLQNMPVMSEADVEVLDAAGDAYESIKNDLVVGIAPALAEIARRFHDIVGALVTFLQSAISATRTAGASFRGGISGMREAVMGGTLSPFGVIGGAVKGAMKAMAAQAGSELDAIRDVAMGAAANAVDAAIADQQEMKRRMENRRRAGRFNFEPFSSQEKRVTFRPLISGAGVAIGNFAGVGSVVGNIERRKLQLAEQSAQALKRIEQHTSKLDRMTGFENFIP